MKYYDDVTKVEPMMKDGKANPAFHKLMQPKFDQRKAEVHGLAAEIKDQTIMKKVGINV